MTRTAGSRAAAFVRSVALLGLLAIGVPVALMFAADERFGGRAPLHGVASPAEWELDTIRSALTDRLTDETVADVVIRLSLLVAWAAVIVLVLTVIAEAVHMVRHDGLPMPDVRGLGLSQRTARVIASGLLVIVPMFATPSRAIARDTLVPEQRPETTSVLEAPDRSDAVGGLAEHAVAASLPQHSERSLDEPVAETTPPSDRYVVKPGDSIFGIAERVVGPDHATVAAYAERLLDANLGRPMPDGQHFTNAAYIEVGWVLELPPQPPAAAASTVTGAPGATAAGAVVHVVEEGETLWSIADDELGDPERWPEIYEANRGRSFDDGRSLDDPDLIQPGWRLDVPGDEVPIESVATLAPGDARAENVWIPKHDLADVAEVGAGDDGPAVVQDASAPATPASDRHPATAETPAAETALAETPVTDTPARTDVGAPPAADLTGADQPADASPTAVADVSAATGGGGAQGRREGSATPSAARNDRGAPTALLSYGAAAMLSAGVLTLLAVRRRNQLRRARPRARLPEQPASSSATERALRAVDPGERFARVGAAIAASSEHLVRHGSRVLAVLVGTDGSLELRVTAPASLPSPWTGADTRWRLDAATPIELLDHGADASPCPTLVQLGQTPDGHDVYLDLEAVEALEVGGPGDEADAIVAAIAATLAGSTLAEVTTLVGLGVADDAFLGHRLHVPARDSQRAFEAAADAIGSTASMSRSTFELRVGGQGGETWEPAVVLIGSAAGTIPAPRVRTGLAVVSASPILGPSGRLAPDGDAWELKPAGIRLRPVGLAPDDIAAISGLVTVIDPPVAPVEREVLTDGDHTVVGPRDEPADLTTAGEPPAAELLGGGDIGEPATSATVADEAAVADDAAIPSDGEPAVPAPAWSLLVRLLGPVEVMSPEGAVVEFERSKTRELVAWLATHRERSTRTAARTALWELDVRDATFANVVSEARRSLARLVEPPEGEEWVGRTHTDALPLHDLVRTDADVLEHALDAALLQPPAQAIDTLSPAVDLIVGMPFEGTSYLWPDAEGLTSTLVLLATSAATELAAHCLSVGDIDGVFLATGRGLRVLPGHEELIGLRMQAHARAGDHAGVRQEWESYERVITADPWSDGEPSPKLVELRRELLNPTR
ncbi:MAG: LysM peptidoglycan-binding domain-containing protein [Ilumatobacter sp.]|uniref:LysM peptidoglycan-binding domain-containing protein n=1 Tax=Ilumatobacter sp. TaxID=1967498 RepID=UPI00262CED8B|nr:LysM peptidoglycan-binding domain-containing protein [Ilumatobacter sp.]MDJ0767996.1 LysM peptidoglycan-binding domain-containing protein [Ilumatobacter sp.]